MPVAGVLPAKCADDAMKRQSTGDARIRINVGIDRRDLAERIRRGTFCDAPASSRIGRLDFRA